MMFQHLHLHMNERAVLVRDGKPEKALAPGRYTFEVDGGVRREVTVTEGGRAVLSLP